MTAPTTVQTTMINFTIDGKQIQVPKGTTVYNAAKQHGIELPIFCYQDRMPPFGACRVCLVEVEKMPKLQTSCTLEATEGMVVKTQTQMAVKGRNEILEFLLINHPLDCPICDRGGECPLQENALRYGPGESRFFEDKRHFKKPLPLGPVLMLDRERCIICARCTRFGDLVAGDHALEFVERGYRTEVGTPDGAPAKSKFIGNTIMICPVGALTSQVYRFRARPWDNAQTNSSCTLCPVGCSMILDSRDGEIMRTRSLENKDLNDIWLCDKGWFGYEFTSNPNRLQTPLIRTNGKLQPVSWEEAISYVAEKINAARSSGKLAGWGGNPLTVEENYLFQRLIRTGGGATHVDHRIGGPYFKPAEEGLAPGMEISVGECEELSYAVIFGCDLTEEFPVIWLRLKLAVNRGAKIIFVGNYLPEIAMHLEKTVLHAPGQELEAIGKMLADIAAFAEKGKKGAVFVGSQYLNNPNRPKILSELVKLRQTSRNLSLNLLEGSGNSMGARFAGMLPDLGPQGEVFSKPGLNALQVLEASAKSGWDFLYVAGANPANKFPSKLWKEGRAKLGCLVVQDLFLTETAEQADVVLPTLSYIEKGGSFLNIEGRVQTLMPGKEIPEGLFSDGEIFRLIAQKLNFTLEIDASFSEALEADRIVFKKNDIAHLTTHSDQNPTEEKGSLLATFAPALFDHGVRMKHNPNVLKLSPEPRIRVNPAEAAKRGISDGDPVRCTACGNSISGKIKLDKGVAEGTIVMPLGFEEVPVYDLSANLLNGLSIELSRI